MAASKPVEAAVVAAAGPGSGSGVGGGSATSGPGTGSLPRWQLALAVGAPLLLGAGALYLWSRQRRRRETGARGDSGGLKRNSERKTPEGRASPAPGSGHPDGPGTHLEMAKQYMEEENYDKIISECSKEIDAQGKYMAEALLLRATFYLLIGNANAAKPDLDQVISLQEANVKLRANALIKRGSMYMQQQQPLLSTQDFNMAADIDPQNADVYHHRGQLKILLDQVEEAVADFDECIRLRPESALAQAQKCFALALTDQQQFGKADEMYDKCINLEPDNATTYVHKGLLQLQWKQDLDKGLELISKAIEIDNKCDFAYETMGTIEVQRGNMEKAIDMFNKAINLAKSEMEMAHLYSLCDAAHAQTEVAKKYGLKPPTL
ncbi:hypothetical protein K5549_003751 [Capra hircus]|nr:hypothetical protein K5549_003751 [Capra hircus]